MLQALLQSLVRSFEELSRGGGRHSRKRPHSQIQGHSTEPLSSELPTLSASKIKGGEKPAVSSLQETEIDQKVSFHEIAGFSFFTTHLGSRLGLMNIAHVAPLLSFIERRT